MTEFESGPEKEKIMYVNESFLFSEKFILTPQKLK